MIDCSCGRSFLNDNERQAHAIESVVLGGESADRHRRDNNGPSVS